MNHSGPSKVDTNMEELNFVFSLTFSSIIDEIYLLGKAV